MSNVPNPSYVFRGVCRGGPWDGKLHAWGRPEYRAAQLPKFYPFRQDAPKPDIIDLKWGTYRYVLGQWIWRDD